MRTKQLYVVVCAVLVGVILQGPAVLAVEPQLVVPPEVALGNPLTVIVTGYGNATSSGTVSVTAPNGQVLALEAFTLQGTTYVWSEVVTEEWGWGRGYVSLVLRNETGNETMMIQTFEVICPPGCIAGLIRGSVQDAMLAVWVVSGLVVLVALAFVGHASHVYRVDRGELSWVERLILISQLTLRRDPLRRDRVDKTGTMPEAAQRNLQQLQDVANKLAELERTSKEERRRARFLEAEILLRAERVKKAGGGRESGEAIRKSGQGGSMTTPSAAVAKPAAHKTPGRPQRFDVSASRRRKWLISRSVGATLLGLSGLSVLIAVLVSLGMQGVYLLPKGFAYVPWPPDETKVALGYWGGLSFAVLFVLWRILTRRKPGRR